MERFKLHRLWILFLGISFLFVGLYLLTTPHAFSVQAYSNESGQRPLIRNGVNLRTTEAFTVYLPLITRYYPPSPSVFGVEMSAVDNAHGLVEAREAGVRWVRLAAFPWDRIEPEPGDYHWDVVDEESLKKAAENDMEVIAVVKYTPAWAQKVEGSRCGPIKQDALDDFARFLTEAVRRYSSSPYSVRYWELGNEPDVRANISDKPWGCWGDESDPYFGGGYYAEMLKVAYPAIKSVDSSAKVVIGSLLLDCHPDHEALGLYCSPGRENSGKFLEGILRGGGGDYFDVVGFHAYAYVGSSEGEIWSPAWSQEQTTSILEKNAFLQGVLTSYGYPDKGLMNTECALDCTNLTDACLETQAMYVLRAYAEAIALGLESQVYYAMTSSWKNTGLLWPSTMEPKPVYEAYKVASAYLSDANYEGSTGYTGVQGYTFYSKGTQTYIDVIWSPDNDTHKLKLSADAVLYDRYGEPLNTSGEVEVDYAPIYVMRRP